MSYLCSHHEHILTTLSFRKKTDANTHWYTHSAGMNTHMSRRLDMDVRMMTPPSVKEKERTCSTDGRQSWIRDGIDTAAITRLWQIYRLAHSEPGPLLRWSPSFTLIPTDIKALINMQTSAFSCPSQLSFSWHFHRNIQGYCRIISRLRARESSVWNIMNTCMVLDHV